ncbi:8506_t:CDS:2 [Gigaspora margarita]|uniref:8506_t:CDS:1 n=1 Tax=Gigaspora margarita TaxID=4874 RepID=A0ABM8W1V8_GIGMA|nr:8506_t:CDS:2 [Gigaspora margarita]
MPYSLDIKLNLKCIKNNRTNIQNDSGISCQDNVNLEKDSKEKDPNGLKKQEEYRQTTLNYKYEAWIKRVDKSK